MNLKLLSVAVTIAVTLAACSIESNDNSSANSGADSNADALAALQTEVRDLQAREDIRALFADYGRTLDDRDFDAFGTLFAADAEFVGGGSSGVASGPTEIAAMLERAIMSNPSGVTSANLHVYSNEKIEVRGDTATATSRGAFIGESAERRPQALIYATYRDQFVRESGAWKFKRREIIGDIPAPAPASTN